MASDAILAEWSIAAKRLKTLHWSEDRRYFPRSSNGRTAAFGAVNRGSNPCRGATTFLPQLRAAVLLTAAPARSVARIPNIPQVFASPRVLSGWKRGIAGVRAQPPGLRPNPTFSLANSPVSPVDRRRLLTAPSNPGGRDFGSKHRPPGAERRAATGRTLNVLECCFDAAKGHRFASHPLSYDEGGQAGEHACGDRGARVGDSTWRSIPFGK